MEIFPCVWIAILSSLWATDFTNSVSLPLMSKIDCINGTTTQLGVIDEGFTGDIEIIYNVQPVQLFQLKLDTTRCPYCAPYLQLTFNGKVRAKNPLDRETLKTGVLDYRIICTTTGVAYDRSLTVRDLNDNAPVFEKNRYWVNVAPTLQVGKQVVQVRAVDADYSPANNRITYSIQPPSNTFEVNGYGGIHLRELLNDSRVYTFTVKAQDPGGLFSITSVRVSTTCSPQNEYLSLVIQNQDMLWWCRYVVVISLNQECRTVNAKLCEMKKALANALSWSVRIIGVSHCHMEDNILHIDYEFIPRQVNRWTNVSFIASFPANEYELIPKETVQKKLRDDKKKVLGRMQQIFGQHVQYDIVDEDNRSDNISTIILGSLLALVCIGAVGAVFLMHRRTKNHKLPIVNGDNKWRWERNAKNRKSKDDQPNFSGRASVEEGLNLGEESSVSVDDRPNLGDRASIDDGPNLGVRAFIDDGPNFGDRASIDDRPNFGEKVSLQGRQGIY